MHASNWKIKTTKIVEKNKKKKNLINVTGDKFAMSIRRAKLKISFCKTFFSFINCLQLLK